METTYISESRPSTPHLGQRTRVSGKWACVVLGFICATMFLDTQFHAVGAKIRLFDVTFAVVTSVYALSILLSRRVRRVPGGSFILAFSALTLYWVLNAFFLASPTDALKELLQAISFIAFFWILKDQLAEEESFQIFLVSFFLGVWGLSAANAAVSLSSGNFAGFKSLGALKLTHSYSLVLTIVAAGYWFGRKKWYVPLTLIAVAAALTIVAGERKAWLAAVAGIVVASAFTETGRLATSRIAQRGLLIFAIALPLVLVAQASSERSYLAKQVNSTLSAFDKYFNPAYDPLSDTRESISNRVRLYVSDQAWSVFDENPVFGLGVNRFVAYIEQRSTGLPTAFSQGIHNEYLRTAAETGLVGLAFYLMVLFIVMKRAVLCVRSMPFLSRSLQFRTRIGISLLAFGLVMNAFKASTGLSVLIIFLPAVLLFFPSLSIRLPNGARRLASAEKIGRTPADASGQN